jgi:hypothetical protein
MSQTVPELRWKFSESLDYRGQLLNPVFRDWHRAKALGMLVDQLEIGGKEKTAEELRRLNFWICADGAWRASALPYWDGAGLLSDVLTGDIGSNFRVGPCGGGRAAGATVFPLRWYQPQHFQGELGFEG